jgi:hypothetical protein
MKFRRMALRNERCGEVVAETYARPGNLDCQCLDRGSARWTASFPVCVPKPRAFAHIA